MMITVSSNTPQIKSSRACLPSILNSLSISQETIFKSSFGPNQQHFKSPLIAVALTKSTGLILALISLSSRPSGGITKLRLAIPVWQYLLLALLSVLEIWFDWIALAHLSFTFLTLTHFTVVFLSTLVRGTFLETFDNQVPTRHWYSAWVFLVSTPTFTVFQPWFSEESGGQTEIPAFGILVVVFARGVGQARRCAEGAWFGDEVERAEGDGLVEFKVIQDALGCIISLLFLLIASPSSRALNESTLLQALILFLSITTALASHYQPPFTHPTSHPDQQSPGSRIPRRLAHLLTYDLSIIANLFTFQTWRTLPLCCLLAIGWTAGGSWMRFDPRYGDWDGDEFLARREGARVRSNHAKSGRMEEGNPSSPTAAPFNTQYLPCILYPTLFVLSTRGLLLTSSPTPTNIKS
ncbi:hypothetical protein T439DRAFT_384125, partial [Meredithblackwellia eburnea MCA 4105]